jgi:UDP-N-acetylglucosamine kinase
LRDCSGQEHVLLDESDSRRIFRDRIVPDQLSGSPQERPVVVFVAGQPGDGKATITSLVKTLLRDRGRPVVLSAAGYEPYHPRFHEPITDDPPTAGPHVEADGRRWLVRARDLVIEQRYDAILETELRDPDCFGASALRFKAAGFRVEVAMLAVPEAVSRLGVLERHLRSLENFGYGRLTPESAHDAGYAGVLQAAELVDTGEWADLVAVLRPNGELVYANHRDAEGQWEEPARTAEAISQERDRPWTVLESRHFLETASQVGRIGLRAPADWILDESVRGSETARAMARPQLHPDAVTLHIATAGTLSEESRATS